MPWRHSQRNTFRESDDFALDDQSREMCVILRTVVVLSLILLCQSFSLSTRRALVPLRRARGTAKMSSLIGDASSAALGGFLDSTMLVAEQKINIDPYQTTGVPPVFLLLSLGLVAGFAAIPVISRKRQVSKNSRSMDETAFYDEALEEKLNDRELLNESYESGTKYTKD